VGMFVRVYLGILMLLAVSIVTKCNESSLADSTDDISCARIPPSLWCSCDKLSEKCGFTEKCKQFRRSSYNKPVSLTLLYESLCPGCSQFITQVLSKASAKFSEKYLKVELIPYGNARRQDNSTTFTCQHGEEECKGNKFESCVLRFIAKPLPFIVCLEKQLPSGTELEKAAGRCFRSLNISHTIYDQINHCYNGELGNQLQLQAAERTEQVWPDQHVFVPWVLFNNVSLENRQFLQSSIDSVICDMYIGDDSPPGCGDMRSLELKVPLRKKMSLSRRDW